MEANRAMLLFVAAAAGSSSTWNASAGTGKGPEWPGAGPRAKRDQLARRVPLPSMTQVTFVSGGPGWGGGGSIRPRATHSAIAARNGHPAVAMLP